MGKQLTNQKNQKLQQNVKGSKPMKKVSVITTFYNAELELQNQLPL